eukprot:1380242-Pleurochrysis_carterae.AAC.1
MSAYTWSSPDSQPHPHCRRQKGVRHSPPSPAASCVAFFSPGPPTDLSTGVSRTESVFLRIAGVARCSNSLA